MRYAKRYEKKGRKACLGFCALLSLIISSTFSGLFWDRLLISLDYDRAVKKTVPGWGSKSAYDSCPGADFEADIRVAKNFLQPHQAQDSKESSDEEEDVMD